jgi:hypothetical protein
MARHLLRAKDLADARYAEPLAVADLARAATLLRTTDRPVADICLAVGLCSVGSFTTGFTRTFGRSPTAHRDSFPPAARDAVIPMCMIRIHGRPQHRTFREDTGPSGPSIGRDPPRNGGGGMRITPTLLWVHDQDEALAFYTGELGWEVRADVTVPQMDSHRWLTVGPVGQPDVAVVLNAIPGPPVMDMATANEIRSLMAKGRAGAGNSLRLMQIREPKPPEGLRHEDGAGGGYV